MVRNMNVALYLRVSTSEQSVEAQRLELRAYCASRGWVIAHEFEDTISGAKAARPGLDGLMSLVRAKAVNAICAVKIDRIARSVTHFSKIAAELVKRDVALICPGQMIDTSKSNPCGKFQMHMMSAVAELERDFTIERTKAGLAVARANGKILGRPSTRLPPMAERKVIVAQWQAEGARDYRELGARLGGVSGATAWRLAKKLGVEAPAPSLEVE